MRNLIEPILSFESFCHPMSPINRDMYVEFWL